LRWFPRKCACFPVIRKQQQQRNQKQPKCNCNSNISELQLQLKPYSSASATATSFASPAARQSAYVDSSSNAPILSPEQQNPHFNFNCNCQLNCKWGNVTATAAPEELSGKPSSKAPILLPEQHNCALQLQETPKCRAE
jgi:hypothetical protein